MGKILFSKKILQNFVLDGSTPQLAGTSALQIKNDTGTRQDGLYWIKNNNINSGNPFQVYCDMNKNGGGWILVLNVTDTEMNWSTTNIGLRNTNSPVIDETNPYSIIDWSDYLKRNDGVVWQWMIEASISSHTERYYGGGIFHSSQSHTMNTTALQSGVVADEWFPNPDNYSNFNTDQGIGEYVPHKGGHNYGTSSIFTTDDNDSSWWGNIVQGNNSVSSYGTGPWRSSGYGNMTYTAHKRVWVR